MLGSMRSFLDKYQKPLLVALAAFLIAVFTIPFTDVMRRRQEYVLGTIYGKQVTYEAVESLRARWGALKLGPRVQGIDVAKLDTTSEDVYLLLLTARQRGIQAGSDAVAGMIYQTPLIEQRIEYVLADPDKLAPEFSPPDAEVHAYYDRTWKDKTEPFDKVKDKVRAELVKALARGAAARRIREARALAAAPTDGDALLNALSAAADAAKLDYRQTDLFTERDAPYALLALAEHVPMDLRRGAPPVLPADFARLLFRIEAGKLAPIIRAADKHFFFRVIEIQAGFSAGGKFFNEDWGWRNGRFTRLETYPDYPSLIRAKRRLGSDDVTRTYDEYLTVQKFINLLCGPQDGLPLTRDERAQLLSFGSEQVKGLLLDIPVDPFVPEVRVRPFDKDQVLDFYNARRSRTADPNDPNFGYGRPDKVQIEFVLADLKRLRSTITIPESDIVSYYDARKTSDFLSEDRRTPKPLDAVRADIVKALKETLAASRAETLLRSVADQAQTKLHEPLPLQPPAEAAGFEYRMSRPFARSELRTAVPDLASSQEFAQDVFSEGYRPRAVPFRGASVRMHPISRTYTAQDKAFLFRIARFDPAQAVDFTALTPDEQAQVENDYAHVLAQNRAEQAARLVKAGIARALIALAAGENKWTVKTASVSSTAETGAALVPPALAAAIKHKPHVPGEIIRLVQEGGTCYTAATTAVDRQTDRVQIEYVTFKPDEFIAVLDPSQEDIDERAATIRDQELEKKRKEEGKDKEPPKPDEERPKPTDKQLAQAKADLIDAWKKKPLRTRYLDYLEARLQRALREYTESNPLTFERDETLRAESSFDFIHEDDEYALRGDKGLLAAAFKLEPGKLSAPVAGDADAAVLLVEAQENRKEAKFEMLSVRPTLYDPLSVTVTDAEAAKYYEANKEQFRRPARARAEFLFASFDDVAALLERAVSEKQVEQYYNQHREDTYKGRMLDADLRKAIRGVLARKDAEEKESEAGIRAALAAAKSGAQTFDQIAAATPPPHKLTSGTTDMLEPREEIIDPIGYAPKLVEAILAAKKGEVAEPVKTDSGWALFRVTERAESSIPELKDALPAVRAKVRANALAARARLALEQVRTQLAAPAGKGRSIKDLLNQPDLAAALPQRTEAVTTGFLDFDRALGQSGMTTALRTAAFNAQPGQVTAVVETEDNLQIARVIDAKTNRVVRVHGIVIPATLFAPMADVTDQDLAAQYEANKAKYERPKRYEVECVTAATWKLRNSITPTDEEVRDAYTQLQSEYLDKDATQKQGAPAYEPLDAVRDRVAEAVKKNRAQKKAEELAAQVLAAAEKDKAKPFKDLAAAFKDLDYTPSVEYAPGAATNPLELQGVAGLDAFLAGAKPGDTSALLRSGGNPLLVRVTKILDAQVPPLAEVKAKVKDDVAKAKGLAQAKDLAGKVAAKIAAPTKAAMSQAAGQFTVRTRDVRPLRPYETRYITRADMRYRLAERLFELRPAEISEPPILLGETAPSAILAVLTDTREAISPQEEFVLQGYAMQAVAERYLNLLLSIRNQYRRTAAP